MAQTNEAHANPGILHQPFLLFFQPFKDLYHAGWQFFWFFHLSGLWFAKRHKSIYELQNAAYQIQAQTSTQFISFYYHYQKRYEICDEPRWPNG